MSKNIIITVVVALVFGFGGFYPRTNFQIINNV